MLHFAIKCAKKTFAEINEREYDTEDTDSKYIPTKYRGLETICEVVESRVYELVKFERIKDL